MSADRSTPLYRPGSGPAAEADLCVLPKRCFIVLHKHILKNVQPMSVGGA